MIGQVHTIGTDAVYIGASASDDAVLLSLDDAVTSGLPLRVCPPVDGLTIGTLLRVSALAASVFPAWRWLWSFTSGSAGTADLFHVQQGVV